MKAPEKVLTTSRAAQPRQRVLRVAHLTEMHIQPERHAAEGVIACLQHVHSLPDRPDLILNGGDSVMDAVAANEDRVNLQWNLWEQVMRDHCTIPMRHCLGNHDVWGWSRKSGCTGNEPLFGKKSAMQRLQISNSYYRFDLAGWRFIVLDSIFQTGPESFEARLDPLQTEWLKAEIAATEPEIPILVLSHIPLLGGAGVFLSGNEGEAERTGVWIIPGNWMHIDARALHTLFIHHSNVKLCLSGHTHLQDRLEVNRIHYLNNGSVSGQWWRGNYHHTPAGYALLDLYADGCFQCEYVPTGWIAADNSSKRLTKT